MLGTHIAETPGADAEPWLPQLATSAFALTSTKVNLLLLIYDEIELPVSIRSILCECFGKIDRTQKLLNSN